METAASEAQVEDIDALVAVDAGQLDDEAARHHVLALHAAKARLDAATVAASGVVDRRCLHRADGARSMVSWLAGRVGASRRDVALDVRLARALRTMPVVAEAFAAGRLARGQVAVFVEVRTDAVAGVFARMEEMLVDQVAGLTGVDTLVFLRAWRDQARLAVGDVDPDQPAPPAAPRVAVDCDRTFDGRWVLSGEMDAEHGALIGGAISAQVDAMFKAGVFTTDDGLSPAERRGQALAEVIAQRAQPRMRHGRPRPSVEVICDERTLLGVPVTDPDLDDGDDLASRVCAFADRTPMALTTLSRLLCGAEVHRIVVGADGEVLDVGKTSRLATRAQRRALAHRHAGHCAFPGCEAPFDWCEMHHIQPWQPGPDDPRGATDLANLVPLCALHHHRVHDEGFTITVRPDGTTAVQRPGPGRCPITPARAHPQLPAVHPDTTRARARINALITTPR